MSEATPRVSLAKIFAVFALIGVTSFGGGIVAYLRRALVAEARLAQAGWEQSRAMRAGFSALRQGVALNDGLTSPARARLIDEPPGLWPRTPPIRVRQSKPTAWIELIIQEGRNRQVRRMTAAVGLPTLRLIRAAIGPYSLQGLAPGQWRQASAADCQATLQQP